jgi:SAM-dependent methyltransferase
MPLIGGKLGALILNRYQWRDIGPLVGYQARSKLDTLFGSGFWDRICGKTVLDFGCGEGLEALEVAQSGALEVIGIDIREELLASARARLAATDVRNCTFVREFNSTVDVILSVDSFEHFDCPDLILEKMSSLLRPEGRVIFSFGPPWFHPKGGHFPLFPWAHVLLTEKALMKWRSQYKTDRATHFREVAGGLNQMSIRKFESLVAKSSLKFESCEAVPIRIARPIHGSLTREFLTSVVRGSLVRRS